MNTQDLAPIQRQVDHNQAAGWSWCLVGPEHMQEVLGAYRDAWRKLGAIHELAQQGLLALADHHLDEDHDPNVKDVLGEIAELSDVS